ncbi:DUF190 domain-containing protein [Pseudodesulfovibrio sp.]|uniref:DUF190 domain-containing protein n=1 Tax=unclassified Pseudodesulfovibrio TaxID=2661612 RepID=UPI003AFFF951
MKGYLVIFFTQRSRTHEGIPVSRWIIEAAKELGARGATLLTGSEGLGHDGRLHMDNYFDLEDAPEQITMALTAEECNKLLHLLKDSNLRVFYTRSEIEFGFTIEN